MTRKTTTAAAPGGASSVHFIHDQFGRLIAEHNGSTGAALREYVWLGLMPVAFIDYSSGSTVTYYLHVDQVMNPQKLTNASGAVVWDRVQDPFGVEVSATGSLTLPSRFPGQVADDETDLHQNWHRDYDPSLGRYVQSDPMGLMGGINTYAYVEGNPLVRVDMSGLAPVCNYTDHPIVVGGGTGSGRGHDGGFRQMILPPGQCVGRSRPLIDDDGAMLTDVDVADFNCDGKVTPPMSNKELYPRGEKIFGDDKGLSGFDSATGFIFKAKNDGGCSCQSTPEPAIKLPWEWGAWGESRR